MTARRRALSNLGGPTEVFGDRAVGALLRHAFESAGGAPDPGSIHGFHTYPARMDPRMAEVLVGAFADPGGTVLDPFCGGGTVPVEARRAGMAAVGIDLSPLAVRLSRVRCDPGTPARRRALVDAARRTARRVRRGGGPRYRIPRSETRWYAPHVLAELSALRGAIGAVRDGWVRERLLLAFSSLVVKASRQRADTAPREVDVRLARGAVTRWFLSRVDELFRGLEDLARTVPRRTPPARIERGDARRADAVVGRGIAHAIVSSPPYGGTYDYAEHHARRHPWLGIDPSAFAADEIGARRDGAASPPERYDAQVLAYLQAAARVLRPGGWAVWVVGDARWAGRTVDVRTQFERLAPRAGFEPRAWARQPRPDPGGGSPRYEWIVALERTGRG